MKKTIICFGDSNTHGYSPETGGRYDETERFPCLLEKYLGGDYLVKEEGLGGRTTVYEDPLFEGLSGLSAISSCLMTHEPVDLLIIMLGTNDTKERFSSTPANIAKGMERLIKKAQSITDAFYNRVPNILLIAPPPIEDGYETTFIGDEMGKDCAKKSRELAFYYEKTAALTGVRFLDAGKIPGMKMHSNDYMHFTKESHDILAKTLAGLIPGYETK